MALEKTIEVEEGRSIKFRASALSPVIYQKLFDRDFFTDLFSMSDALEEVESINDSGETETPKARESLTADQYKTFMRIAYCYAYQALNASPFENQEQKEFRKEYPNEWAWLDSFTTFSILVIMPQLMEIMGTNSKQLVKAKKNNPVPLVK